MTTNINNECCTWKTPILNAPLPKYTGFGMILHSMHNPPCESPWAELSHGVIERSAAVFADRGAIK